MVSSTTTLIKETAIALQAVPRGEPASKSLRLDTTNFKQFINKFSNTITKALAFLLLEPSILSSLNTTIKSIKREATILEPITLIIYTLERKREALRIYTSFRSSSYKLRKITISSSLSKVIKVIEYKYNIVES